MNHPNRAIDLYPRLARVWFAPLALMAACGGNASGTGNGAAGSAQAGAASAGMGSNAAGSGNAGSGGTAGNGANAGAAAGGSAGTATAAGGSAGSGGNGATKHCGGIAGIACGKEEYCKFPESVQCGAGDQSGECIRSAGGCTLDYSPVCGCDGKTYGNECAAAMAGVSIARAGACDATPPGSCSVTPDGASYPDGSTEIPKGDGCNVCTCAKGVLNCTARPCKAPTRCGAMAGDTCSATEYCAYQSAGLCGAADQQASCEPRPSLCSTLYQPVCGCDRKTYPNTCSAALAGTGVLQAGPCPV